MSHVVFDIETEPLPEDELRQLCPPFDPAEVKTGNLKDPDKIKARVEAAEAEHFTSFVERAALDAATGRVLAIGVYHVHSDQFTILHDDSEKHTLVEFWKLYQTCFRKRTRMVGCNIFGFDLPFLVRRSWILGVYVPDSVCDLTNKWCNWNSIFVDLRNVWQLGDKQCRSSFKHICAALGMDGKHDGMDGSEFAKVWREDRETAILYLKRDCMAPAAWLHRFGMVEI